MPPTRFKMDKGWKKWEYAISKSALKGATSKHMKRASVLNGKIAEATIRKTIKGGGFEKNADLTIMIKSSSKPLVDYGTGLFQAITSQVMDNITVFAGVIRTDGFYDIAVALHEGVSIVVTPRMRGLFFWLWQASEGIITPDELSGRASELWERAPGGWAPLKSSTSHIVIPSRPFIKKAFADNELQMKAKENWQKALQLAMKELSEGK